jgi:hypothetical protein
MKEDLKYPSQVKKTLLWFGSIIGRPIDEDSRMNHISPSGELMEIEAADYIVPSPTLRPSQRIQIYNQQYWWRLLNHLHEIFPFLTRLLGYYEFNKNIGIPYLDKYPPQHWSLVHLGDRLVGWIEDEYVDHDKELIYHAAKIDIAYNDSFFVRQCPSLPHDMLANQEELEQMLGQKLYIQPHIHLFELPYHLFNFRNALLERAIENRVNHDFPQLIKDHSYYFIVYRNSKSDICWKEISHGEYHLLGLLQQGTTIDHACDWLEHQDTCLFDDATKHLHDWFQEWTARNWLTFEKEMIKNYTSL